MKNLLKFSCVLALVLVLGCEENYTDGSSEVFAFESAAVTEFVEIDGTKTAQVAFYTGNITGNDRTFGVVVDEATTLDGAAYSVPATVTVQGGSSKGIIEYSITDTNVPLAGAQLVLTLGDNLNGLEAISADPSSIISSNDKVTINVQYEFCPPSNSVALDIVFDAYPGETTWTVTQDGVVIDSGGPYDGETSFSKNWCLESGDYEFTIEDAFGDGMCCSYGDGSYTLTVNGEVVGSGGAFGASETTQFTID